MISSSAQLLTCVTFCDPRDCSPWGSSLLGIFQARVLEWVAMLSSRGSSQSRGWTWSLIFPALAGGFFTTSATWETLGKKYLWKIKCSINYLDGQEGPPWMWEADGSVLAAITEHHRLRGLNNRRWSSRGSQSWKSETRVLRGLVSPAASFLADGCPLAEFSWDLFSPCVCDRDRVKGQLRRLNSYSH